MKCNFFQLEMTLFGLENIPRDELIKDMHELKYSDVMDFKKEYGNGASN